MKSMLLLIFSGLSLGCFSQRLSGYVALGSGSSIEDNIAGCDNQNRLRYIGSMAIYYKITDRFSVGGEAIGSGPLHLFNRSSCDITNEDGSVSLSPSNLRAGSILLRNRMMLFSYKEMEPYIGMGVGLNTYYYSDPVKGAGSVKKMSFIISPEFGINMYKFQFACKVLVGGKTPSFDGADPGASRVVTLRSVKAQQVYLTIGYQLFRL